MSIKCRVAPSLGALERTPEEAWGLETYNPLTDQNEPTVFAGLYGLPDFYTLWRHKGKKYVWWAGSDIRHFLKGYFLDENGDIRLAVRGLADWINKYCENWVENEVEKRELSFFGVETKICPSFLGDVKDYDMSYQYSDRPKVYSSVSGNDFSLYKWKSVNNLAWKNPLIEFHLYGNTKEWITSYKNVIVHGRVPKEQMNEEIKQMQGALRLLPMEGFSEIIAKSVLWGQWPVSLIKYPHMLSVEELGTLKNKKKPNIAGRNYYIKRLNRYPWCTK